MPRPERSSRRVPMRIPTDGRGSPSRSGQTSLFSSRSARQARRGWIASFSRASRLRWEAAVSGARSVRRWTGAPNISPVKGSPAARDSASSSHAICSTPCEGANWERRSEEHTSELQSLAYLVCRLLLEKKKQKKILHTYVTKKTKIKNNQR